MVYVLNKSGNPIMPTERLGKVRRMLKSGQAKIVNRTPFTIQLTYEPETKVVQETTLGMDTGYENVGISVVTEKKELFSGQFKLRNDIQAKLETRRMYRRTRRGNKTRYRKARFLNRKKNYSDAPSIRHKVESHTRVLSFVSKFLPIDNLIIESGSFDTQKIKNPEIHGKGYQQGEQLGYQNVKEYVKARDGHNCYFHKKGKCVDRLEVHHIQFRSNGGSNAPKNLITLCEKHHKQVHSGKSELPNNLKHKRLRATSFMNTVNIRLKELLPDAVFTYGYETKQKRYQHNIEKSHTNDAFVIANGTIQQRIETKEYFFKRKNNRSLGKQRNGFAPSSRKQRYPIQPKDLIRYEGELYQAIGTQNKGKYVCFNIGEKRVAKSIKKLELIYYKRSLTA